MSLAMLLDGLNPRQRAAATLPNRHALILAGAGTGKTKTIVARAAYLIANGTPAHRIRILTFTRKSASEIVERVKLTLGEQAQGLGSSTFHAWCMSLAHTSPKTFGAEGHTILDRDDQLQLFKSVRGKPKVSGFPTTKDLCDLYSLARNTERTLTETLEFKSPEYLPMVRDIGQIMLAYEKKKQGRFWDYDDILEIVAQQLNQSSAARDWVSSLYDHILVDETQDTNPLQWRLLSPLKEKVTLFAVGDDCQSIYGFRGADFKNIHQFPQRVPGAQVLKLEDNYRSTQEILDLSNWLIEQSPLDYGKRLRAVRGPGIKPQLKTFSNEWDEGGWIARDLLNRRNLGADWRDHMILVRSGFAGRVIESALLAAEIPYVFIGGMKLLESAHIKDTLSVLRLVANPGDEIAWMRYLTLWPGVGEVKASHIYESTLDINNPEDIPNVLSKNGKLAAQAVEVVKIVVQLRNNVADALQAAFKAMEQLLSEKYRNQDWDKRRKDIPLVAKLAEKHSSILAFIEEYLLDPLHGSQVDTRDNDDKVTVITIHSAKGTETPVGYVINVSPGAYPSSWAETDEDIEEERRVLYVGLTRAKDELIITRRGFSTWAVGQGPDQAVERYFLNGLPDDLVDEDIQSHARGTTPAPGPLPDKPIKVGIRL